MRLVSFKLGANEVKIGALINNDEQIVDLIAGFGPNGNRPDFLRDMKSFIEGGARALDLGRDIVEQQSSYSCIDRTDAVLLAPLPRPVQMRCFSVFEKHARQSAQAMMKVMASNTDDPEATLKSLQESGRFEIPPVFYERPLYYKGNRMSVIGPDTEVAWPDYSAMIDYELELAAIIGRQGKDVPKEEAGAYIFGYSVFNDLTARDEQSKEMVAPLGPAKGKDFDGGNVIGPCIVTADEIDNPYSLLMTASVNGEPWSEGKSDDMAHRFEDMIAYVSRSETLYPGEIFLSGCVGSGCGMEQNRYPQRGDVIELHIDKIGTLRTRII